MSKSLLEVFELKAPKRIPIWFLRQAGRYLPEYLSLRKNHSFLEVCQNPKLAAEVTLQPLRRYDLDASIVFADILLPCLCMGQELTFAKDHGPILRPSIDGPIPLNHLIKEPAEKLSYVGKTLSILAK